MSVSQGKKTVNPITIAGSLNLIHRHTTNLYNNQAISIDILAAQLFPA